MIVDAHTHLWTVDSSWLAAEEYAPLRCDYTADVVVKLSGLVTLAHWDRWVLDDLRPYVDCSLDLFGTARLMYGSDWPICELAAPYERVLNALVSLLGGLPVNAFSTTAISTYRLEIDDYHRSGPVWSDREGV